MKDMRTLYTDLANISPRTYFAGANTAQGFLNDYPAWIQESALDRLYILKGGSGTGKSTLLRAVASAAPVNAEITYLLCGSDPHSLDAVLIHTPGGKKVALLDGTSPHVVDPEIPGAISEIINLGMYWNTQTLQHHLNEIRYHTAQKRAAYRCVYQFLRTAQNTIDERDAWIQECILTDKMNHAAERLLDRFPKEKYPTVQRRLTYSLSMHGAVHLPTSARTRYCVLDVHGSGTFFLQALRRAAAHRGVSYWYAPFLPHIERPGELYFLNSETSFSLAYERNTEKEDVRCINMSRFLDRAQVAAHRSKLRFLTRCTASLLDGALEALSDARHHHLALEEIYRSAMDFQCVEAETHRIILDIANLNDPDSHV